MTQRSASRLGVFHCTLTGAVALGLLFLLCWFGVAVADIPASRRMLGFFTSQALEAPGAIGLGLVSAVVFGAVIGGLIAISFNALGMMLGATRKRPPQA
ncbi:MAG: hypothetical protein EPO51_20120 [Phenylobacterium sp.]|uniref:hypothetical protein n=1 Tax=Phenylobacterium sp. TaxID=1871053 RepID=UPI0012257BE3|nr:hypothetical protein [Phenylobacterium sp.]TAJ69838.1 MAG: hypothetical protein EPO51_20120 [Phenylobacterium sp.]